MPLRALISGHELDAHIWSDVPLLSVEDHDDVSMPFDNAAEFGTEIEQIFAAADSIKVSPGGAVIGRGMS